MKPLSAVERNTVRAFFALLLLGFVFQLTVHEQFREPYPALGQPAFSGHVPPPGIVITDEPMMTVTYADGAELVFDHTDVMAGSKSSQLTVFASAFGPGSDARREDPATMAWLERRLAGLGDGRRPLVAELEWRKGRRDVREGSDPRYEVVDTFVARFEGGR